MESAFAPRRQAGRLALAIGLGALLTSATGWAAQASDETFGIQGPASKVMKSVRPTPSEKMGVDLGQVPEVRLPAVDKAALLKEDAVNQRLGLVKYLRFGIGRDLKVSVRDGNWYDVAGGARLWAGEVAATDAVGLRLHFKNFHLPAGAEVAVYTPDGASPGVAKSGYSRFDPERNVEFHEATGDPAEFWTGAFYGERVRIEYLAPAGAAADALPFQVDRLQHFYLDPVDKVARSLVGEKDAGSCENDVTCHPEWANVAKAVSGVIFVEGGGGSAFCSGQLLNDNVQDFTPYYLTANHCISGSNQASSAQFFWFYQTSTCNGNPPSLNSVPRSNGATLVSTNPQSDYSLLMVNGALPDGLYWAGWTGKPVPVGLDATGIHHPEADFKRISFGFNDDPSECPSNHVRISWTDGVTEPGSSGSGIFRDDTQQLFGQLHGGPSACGESPDNLFDCYGAFQTTYTRIAKFLVSGSDDSSEQNDTCGRARVVRAGTLTNRIVKVNDSDWYRISVPAHRTVTVTLSFNNGNGDIDLAAFASCGGHPIAQSTGTGNTETVSLVNNGSRSAFAYWDVYLASSTRNTYNMTVSIH